MRDPILGTLFHAEISKSLWAFYLAYFSLRQCAKHSGLALSSFLLCGRWFKFWFNFQFRWTVSGRQTCFWPLLLHSFRKLFILRAICSSGFRSLLIRASRVEIEAGHSQQQHICLLSDLDLQAFDSLTEVSGHHIVAKFCTLFVQMLKTCCAALEGWEGSDNFLWTWFPDTLQGLLGDKSLTQKVEREMQLNDNFCEAGVLSAKQRYWHMHLLCAVSWPHEMSTSLQCMLCSLARAGLHVLCACVCLVCSLWPTMWQSVGHAGFSPHSCPLSLQRCCVLSAFHYTLAPFALWVCWRCVLSFRSFVWRVCLCARVLFFSALAP